MSSTKNTQEQMAASLDDAATRFVEGHSWPLRWLAIGVRGHTHATCSKYVYTSDAPPVEAEEYDRMKTRAEAAEAQLAAVPDYVAYYVTAWGPFEAAGGEGTEPLEFDAWLQARG